MSEGGSEQARTLWHGRFADGPDAALMALSESLSFDRRLAGDDVEGSRGARRDARGGRAC